MKRKNYKDFTIFHYENLDSTNDLALEMARLNNVKNFDIIMADSQNKGRGRMNRVWQSNVGNLYFSLILTPKIDIDKIWQFSFLAAISLKITIKNLFFEQKSSNFEVFVKNKWPNDVLVDDKKIAGILIESQNDNKKCDFLVVGIGVNIKENPQNTIFEATNLANFDLKIEKEDFLRKFLDNFVIFYEKWQNFGFLPIKNLWIEDGWRLQEEISLTIKDEKITGIFEGLNDDGSLILKNENGFQKIISVDLVS